MSHWDNGYSYNNHYQDGTWSNNQSSHHNNQSNNQYVSFNEFLTQVQASGSMSGNSGGYVNHQFHNEAGNQFTSHSQNVNLDSHNLPLMDRYSASSSVAHNPNGIESYPASMQRQYELPVSESSFNKEMVQKSSLMPTAMEFVPKRAIVKTSASSGHISASNLVTNGVSAANWRDESYNSNNQDLVSQQNEIQLERDYKRDGNPQNNGKTQCNNSAVQKYDSNYLRNVNKKYYSAHNGASGPSDGPSDCQFEASYDQYQNQNSKASGSFDNGSLNRNFSSQNQDNNSHESSSRNKDVNQPRYNSRLKNTDSPRTYYKSSGGKGNQDRRNRGDNSGRTKTFAGSQRLATIDRNSVEDEQYANNYLQYKDERQNQNDKSDRQKIERQSKEDRPDRFHKDDRQYKGNRSERLQKDDQPDRNYRENRPERHKYDRSDWQHRDNRSDRQYRDDRQYREDRRDEQCKDNRSDRQYRSDRLFRDERQYREDRTDGQYRDDRSDRQFREGKSDKCKDNRFDRQYKDNRSEKQNKEDRIAKGLKEEISQKTLDQPSPKSRSSKHFSASQGNSALTQRDRLSEQLDTGTLECLVCCERVRQTDQVWSCSNCYHVLHLRCIRKWAISSLVEGKWRCPACQNVTKDIPTEYRCMCGAMRNPEYHRGSTGAHTCGGTCRRPRQCVHLCTLLCHPGPCPPCQATVNKQCGCGAETRAVLCSNKMPQVCGRVCSRALECGRHVCRKDCHEGPCGPCEETVTQVCFCPAAKGRTVDCTLENNSSPLWSCGTECGRVLACGAHVCTRECHAPPCRECELLPERVTTCPCGKKRLDKQARKCCTDPIPLCGNICAKPLICGPDGDNHFCKVDCHQGECPVCPDKTVLQCRCGHSSREVACSELTQMRDNVLCQKKCNKKLSCGRHRCRAVCCGLQSHRCTVVCGRALSCQLHRCEEFCHTGHCAPCPVVSFEELTCECGAEIVFPPVRCGTRPPVCKRECPRGRPCGHPPHHSCHSGDCPPCVVLTTKTCHGGHEERKTIPCSQDEFSCGLPCGKPLPCGKHTCTKTCHKGPCDAGKCTQPCAVPRLTCGHPCAAPCHSAAPAGCPSPAPCRQTVTAVCPCGRRQAQRACADNAKDYNKIQAALAATKMQEGSSVDIAEMRPGNMLKTLECDDECRVEQRTRQMALALQIRNPDISSKLAPRYSDHIRSIAVKDPSFAQQIHDKLTELVQLAKKSKQRTRSHSFPSMNYQKRQFIHELCEHFGCESVAYDAEPNRNVVATADKERSWLPAMSILEVLAREAGKRRVPGPMLRAAPSNTGGVTAAVSTSTSSTRPSGWATLTSTNAWASRSQPKPQQSQDKPADKIDYFDNPPEN